MFGISPQCSYNVALMHFLNGFYIYSEFPGAILDGLMSTLQITFSNDDQRRLLYESTFKKYRILNSGQCSSGFLKALLLNLWISFTLILDRYLSVVLRCFDLFLWSRLLLL